MGLIGTIRNNNWLLIILLGIGLLAFILMDVTSNQNKNMATDTVLGEVDGGVHGAPNVGEWGESGRGGAPCLCWPCKKQSEVVPWRRW